MGLSSRTAVDFKGQTSLFSVICTTEEKEKIVSRNMTNLFIDSLEMFRESQQIENFVLAGHSLGGFLAGKYALKYPKHISSLVLISPVGVPAQPPKDEHMDMNSMDWRIRVAKNLWKMNFTPQSLIRLTGSRGPNLVKPILNRRFSSRWNDEELQLITDYFYQISIAPSSGELGLNALLEPIFLKVKDDLVTSASDSNSGKPRRVSRGGVYAKEPLEQEMVNLDKRIPVLVLYGDNDWLYYPTVEDTMRLWRSHGLNAKYITVSNAGHHLYIENSDHFNKVVLDWANAAYTNK